MAGDGVLAGLVLKLIGSVCGTALALIFAPPRGRRDFQRRAAFSLISGVVMTPIAIIVSARFFDVSDDAESLVAAAAVTAFASWWVAMAVLRGIRGWKP